MAVIDFDMLCATVALQTQGFSTDKNTKEDESEEGDFGGGGGVQRMWEGEVLDCLDDRRIAIESACCPCYRFGKNMRRAKLGPCSLQGSIYFLLVVAVLFNFIAFGVTKQHCYAYVGVASAVSFGLYSGYFRTRIRKQFNIGGNDSSLDDCVYHVVCPCCSLCQESRTLEMNNVQDGVWHGRGETICVGSFGDRGKEFSLCKPSLMPTMDRTSNGSNHSWILDDGHSEPLVAPEILEDCDFCYVVARKNAVLIKGVILKPSGLEGMPRLIKLVPREDFLPLHSINSPGEVLG